MVEYFRLGQNQQRKVVSPINEDVFTMRDFTIENKPKPQAETFRRLAEEYRAADPTSVQRGLPIAAPPIAPKSTERTWQWLEEWIDALPEDYPGQ